MSYLEWAYISVSIYRFPCLDEGVMGPTISLLRASPIAYRVVVRLCRALGSRNATSRHSARVWDAWEKRKDTR